MHQGSGPVAAGLKRLPHDPGAVFLAGHGRLVAVGAPVLVPAQPALLAQVVHHGHHGGVGDAPVLLQVADDVAYRHRAGAGPDPGHYLGFQFPERSHPASSRVFYYPDSSRLGPPWAAGGTSGRRTLYYLLSTNVIVGRWAVLPAGSLLPA